MNPNHDGAEALPSAPRPVTNPLRRAFHLQPDRRRWPAAARAGVSMALPVLIGWLAGELTAGLLATIGTFTALYGIGRPYLNRGIHLAVIVVCFGAAVALGDWAARIPWVGVLAVALIAVTAVLLCNVLAVGPPGAFMFVLACATGTAAAPEHLSPWHLGLLVMGGGALAWLAHMAGAFVAPHGPERAAVSRAADAVARYLDAVGSAEEAPARHRAAQRLHDAWSSLFTFQPARATRTVRRLRQVNYELHVLFAEIMTAAAQRDSTSVDTDSLFGRLTAVLDGGQGHSGDGVEQGMMGRPGPIELVRQAIAPGSVSLVVAGRAGIAVLVVGLIGLALDFDHSYWAMAAAALMLHQGLDWIRTLQRSIERQLGTLVGLALAAVILAVQPQGLVLVPVIAALQFMIVMFTVRNYAIAVVFITCAALVIATGGRVVADVGDLLIARGGETLIGCQIALIVYLLTSRRRGKRLPAAVARTLDAIRSTLPFLAEESVTSMDARIARRNLYLRATDLLPTYEATVLDRQRAVAESMWPAVAAAERLAYRTLSECWTVERVGVGRDPDELDQASVVLGRLAEAFRTGRQPAENGPTHPIAEIAILTAVARTTSVP